MTSRRNAVLQLDSRMLMRDTIGTTSGFDSSIDQSLPAFVSMSASSPKRSPTTERAHMAVSRHLVQLGAMNYVTSTSTDSRLYSNLPKTRFDLNRSMSA